MARSQRHSSLNRTGSHVRLLLGLPSRSSTRPAPPWALRLVSHLASNREPNRVQRHAGLSRRCGIYFPDDTGYFVTAPDLLGHGNAHPTRSDYSVAALADELRPYFTTPQGNDHPYQVIIGYSLGAIVAAALLPRLGSSQPLQVVLVDPPFQFTPEVLALAKTFLHDRLANLAPPEQRQKEFPSWSREDATLGWLSESLCDPAVVQAILDQNTPWSFLHLLASVPDNVQVTVLAADPSKSPAIRAEDLNQYPRVSVKTAWGASHFIPIEAPQVVIETALQGTELQN